MTEQLPPPEAQREVAPEDDPPPMPRWVPLVIGVVLVLLAAFATVTGMRYRRERLTSIVPPQQGERRTAPAPPGAPGAGGSLVVPDGVPQANEPVRGPSRAIVSGGAGGVESVVRMWARRGMILDVTPADAIVYVNDVQVGPANQLDTVDEIYDFPNAGSYTVRVTAPGHRDATYIVTASEEATDNVAVIRTTLKK